jgi:riboflavin kinase/FMN adenylyltransferase
MRIIRDLNELTAPLPNAVVTIGNFDGVHLGHREIFRRVVRKARALDGTATVFTFVPHPLRLLAPEHPLRLINTYAEKERLIEASCIDVLVSAPFTGEMAQMPARRFVEDVLVGRVGLRHLVVGYDYAFGRNREGDTRFLARMGRELGFAVEVLEPLKAGGKVYSSSRIRELVLAGDVAGVVGLLGRHFTLEGEVVHGAKRGNGIGFPTANLRTEKELLPCSGVYAVKVKRGENEVFDGVANIGCNPTFGEKNLSVEVHLFGFRERIYGQTLRLYFVERLRDEMKFSGAADLAKAISADIERARRILAGTRIIEYREYLDCGTPEKRR